jgi:hypothetical protein
MLPSTLQFLIAMIGCAINERIQRNLDYSLEEVRVLQGGPRQAERREEAQLHGRPI